MTVSLTDKYRGCILGQCLADALGYPLEGAASDVCTEFMDTLAKSWFEGERPQPTQWIGQYTDDSQLARELILSIVQRQEWDPPDYARRLVSLFKDKHVVGAGLACDEAAARLMQGQTWREAGCEPSKAGNGTAMRAAPIGLCYANNPQRLCQVAHEQGFITHKDPRCSAGSIAIAGATALAVRDEVDDVTVFCDSLANLMRPYGDDFADFVRVLPDWVKLPPEEAIREIESAGKTAGFEDGRPGISPFVIPSVLWSLYAFLRHRDSYFNAVAVAIAAGGDVDTTGAMTGALSGALLGVKAIPSHLAGMVNDFSEWGHDDLVKLADDLLELVQSGEFR